MLTAVLKEECIKKYRINRQIRAKDILLIDAGGDKVGVMPLMEALVKAQSMELDLVEIAPKAEPPVCRILDFNKFKFDQKKKLKKERKGRVDLKEFRIHPNIGEHDLDVRIRRARTYIAQKHQVKITVQYKGRENIHPEVGNEKLKKFTVELEDIAKLEQKPVKKGNFLTAIYSPI